MTTVQDLPYLNSPPRNDGMEPKLSATAAPVPSDDKAFPQPEDLPEDVSTGTVFVCSHVQDEQVHIPWTVKWISLAAVMAMPIGELPHN